MEEVECLLHICCPIHMHTDHIHTRIHTIRCEWVCCNRRCLCPWAMDSPRLPRSIAMAPCLDLIHHLEVLAAVHTRRRACVHRLLIAMLPDPAAMDLDLDPALEVVAHKLCPAMSLCLAVDSSCAPTTVGGHRARHLAPACQGHRCRRYRRI